MKPTNGLAMASLTDLYQITMTYASWKHRRHELPAVFELFFRKNPASGGYTIFGGLEEAARYIENFRFTEADIRFLRDGLVMSRKKLVAEFEHELKAGIIVAIKNKYWKRTYCPWGEETRVEVKYPHHDLCIAPPMGGCDPDFFRWLRKIDCSQLKISAIPEGTVVFPRVPLIRVEGPLAAAQLVETGLLNLVNYASLMMTNASWYRSAAGREKIMLEFGLRRAQGPDGGVSASRYSYYGGFDGTSNVLAGRLHGLPVKGTHAHSYVQGYESLDDLEDRSLVGMNGKNRDFVAAVLRWREKLGFTHTNEGELAAFIAYAQAFPRGFLALVDTYNIQDSGVPNYICVATALRDFGYNPIGIRIDSGDLAHESKMSRGQFIRSEKVTGFNLSGSVIVASNDINEEVLDELNKNGHEIDSFGVGTHLVTCQSQPALGCVYKLVEINGDPRIKLSKNPEKRTIPGRKSVYRLVGENGFPICDLMLMRDEEPPQSGKPILTINPLNEIERSRITPVRVIELLKPIWDGRRLYPVMTPDQIRNNVLSQIRAVEERRPDFLRRVNPTPYHVSVSGKLNEFMRKLLLTESTIPEYK